MSLEGTCRPTHLITLVRVDKSHVACMSCPHVVLMLPEACAAAAETVAICTPINVLIAPSSDYYQVVVEAETQVRQALAIDVNGKGLGIGALP